jgi:hypothetical protein
MEETEYLRSGATLVTSTRIEIGGQTFAVRNVGSVKVTTPGRPWIAFLLGLLGVSFAAQEPIRWAGLLMIGAAGVWIWQQMRMKRLVLVSGGGEVVALKSTDGKAVEALRAAISQAISAR